MNITLLSLTISVLLGLGLLFGLVALNFLVGTLDFFFGKAKFEILKSSKGINGFSFLMRWDPSKEEGKFHQVKIKLFNPFGSPALAEVIKEFEPQGESFAVDLDMGPGFQDILNATKSNQATILIEVGAIQDRFFHQEEMKAAKFFDKRREATSNVSEFESSKTDNSLKQYYHTVQKSMIAEPMAQTGKHLKLATNPEFAHEFAGAAAGGAEVAAAAIANFAVSKVWIATGCIVCNACETIYPEVFKVNADTCIVKADYPKDNGLKIKEAAEACPVEVIKYS